MVMRLFKAGLLVDAGKIHRPQTRRRRENNADSLEKLRMIRENVLKALDIFECLVKRERKKRDLLVVSLWEGWDCTYSGWADETACVLQT